MYKNPVFEWLGAGYLPVSILVLMELCIKTAEGY